MKIDGKIIASEILEGLKLKIQKLDITPHLAIILIGDDPASVAYVRQKKIIGEQIGAKTTIYKLPSSTNANSVFQLLNDLNHLTAIHGIIIQRPIPTVINREKLNKAINPKKDVDGFHPKSRFEMPIVLAVLEILKEVPVHLRGGVAPRLSASGGARLEGENIVVIGKGETGGKPIIQMLRKKGIEPIVIDSKTKNPEKLTKKADIIISAAGRANVIKPDMIKKRAILISIGLHKGTDSKLHGDYDAERIKHKASFYTPTPGGVGPINVAMLLKNLLSACENFNR